jgi:hypothetical protein
MLREEVLVTEPDPGVVLIQEPITPWSILRPAELDANGRRRMCRPWSDSHRLAAGVASRS